MIVIFILYQIKVKKLMVEMEKTVGEEGKELVIHKKIFQTTIIDLSILCNFIITIPGLVLVYVPL